MYATYHKQVTKIADAGIMLPLVIFNKEILTLAKTYEHKDTELVAVSNNYYNTFLTFQNGDRIDVKR